VKAARTSIGIVDASTLGKIDIQGPDALKLLNWVYTNAWDNLEIGRARYGLMCGEDGMVFDDGVTTRIGPSHYLMTTTTGNAARVLGWLEEWLQCEWTGYRVWCTSVTEQWATVGVTGPMSRRLLAELTTDIDLDPATFPLHVLQGRQRRRRAGARLPHLVHRRAQLRDQRAPSYALALWQALMMAGEKYQITPYGTEACTCCAPRRATSSSARRPTARSRRTTLGSAGSSARRRRTSSASVRWRARTPRGPTASIWSAC
jgi:sarcosine oxidase subunit alpha